VGTPPAGVADFAPERPRDEVRIFALKCLEAGAPWVVAGAAAPDPVLIVGRAKTGAGDLKTLLPALLGRAGGKGGGAPDFLQLSASDPAAAEAAFRLASDSVPRCVSGVG
jgi:alanyl-tRNA synthetase